MTNIRYVILTDEQAKMWDSWPKYERARIMRFFLQHGLGCPRAEEEAYEAKLPTYVIASVFGIKHLPSVPFVDASSEARKT